MKNYVNVSKNIPIEDHFPMIGEKIKVMTKQTKKDINHFDNITYDNNEYIIRLVREEEKQNKKYKRLHTNEIKSMNTIRAKKHLTVIPTEIKRKDSINYPNIKRKENKLFNTMIVAPSFKSQQLFDQCDEIENRCCTLRNTCKITEGENEGIKSIFKKVEELERLTEIEELLYNKKKIGVKPLMKMKLKNFRILQESDYVNLTLNLYFNNEM